MPDIIDPPRDKKGTRTSRLLWFIGLYCAGLVTTGVVVYVLRALLGVS